MSITNFVFDSSEKEFTERNEFISFIQEREANTQWLENDNTNGVVFSALHQEPMPIPIHAQDMKVSEDAIEDTMERVGLILHTKELGKKPVGDSMVKSMLERAGIRKDGFDKINGFNRNSCAAVMNLMLSPCRGKALIKFSDDKYRALLTEKYSRISPLEVDEIAKEYIAKDWDKATFKYGYFSHEFAREEWDLSAYSQKLLSALGSSSQGLTPVLIVETSDVSLSAVTVSPALCVGTSVVPLGHPIYVAHLGKEIKESATCSSTSL